MNFPRLLQSQPAETNSATTSFLPSSVASCITLLLSAGILAGTFTLTGCAKSIAPEKREPAKLITLPANLNVLTPVLSMNVAERQGRVEHQLQVAMLNNDWLVASPTGTVTSVSTAGVKRWSVSLSEMIVGGVAADAASNTVIVSTKSGKVVALDASNGTIRWQQQLDGTVLAPAFIAQDRVVLSANNGVVYALALRTGTPVWQFTTTTPNISVRGTAKPMALDDNTVVAAMADGRLHALDLVNGTPRWSRRIGLGVGADEISRMADVDGVPVLGDNQLYAASYSGQMIGIDMRDRSILFIDEAKSTKRMTLTPTALIVTTIDGIVKAVNRQTGETIWESEILKYRGLSNPVNIGGYIAVGDAEGYVHLFDASKGTIVSRLQTKGGITHLNVYGAYLTTLTQAGELSVWRLTQ